jgi:molybdopterin converting factor small subunit
LKEIEVRYFATFRKNGIKKETITFDDKLRVEDVLRLKKIEEDEVAILLVNGKKTSVETELKNGDVVSLFPPVGGG